MMKFVAALQRGELTMVEACRRPGSAGRVATSSGIDSRSRIGALLDRSRAPLTQPNRTPVEIEVAILRKRKGGATWGSKKLVDLSATGPGDTVACPQHRGRAPEARRRGRSQARSPTVWCPSSPPVIKAHGSKDVWAMHYKGWLGVGDGTRCDPLTVNDVATRTALKCVALVRPNQGT